MRSSVVAGRIVTAALLVWMAVIHIHLWSAGYRHIHDIGPLFLVDFGAGLAAALAVLAAPRRLLPLAALGVAGLAAGTLAGLLISINRGLFGFRDSLSAPYAKESIAAEALAIAAGLALCGLSYAGRGISGPSAPRRRRSPSGPQAAPEPASPSGNPSGPG
jgi:hypothetical protein